MVEADCSIDGLKADNRRIIEGFQLAGEEVVVIDSGYEQMIQGFMD